MSSEVVVKGEAIESDDDSDVEFESVRIKNKQSKVIYIRFHTKHENSHTKNSIYRMKTHKWNTTERYLVAKHQNRMMKF